MSFLKSLPITSGIGAALHPAEAAQGLGHLLNISPVGLAKFGTAMNGIASSGGAAPGYANPNAAGPGNYLQLLDPNVLQAIMQQMRGGQFQSGQPQGGGVYR